MDWTLIGYLGISFVLLVSLYVICRAVDHRYATREAAQKHMYVMQDINYAFKQTKRLTKEMTKAINDNLFRMANGDFED